MTTALKTVHFHGSLAKKYGKKHEFAFANWFQLLGGLVSRFGPQIKEEIREGKWSLFDGARKAGNDLSEEDIKANRSVKSKTFHLVPAVEGASSVVRIIVGVALIAAWEVSPVLAPYLYPLGASLIIGGVAEMLTKQPVVDQTKMQDENASSIFNSARNVTTQGGPVPLVYGTVVRASSVVITSDFSADETD